MLKGIPTRQVDKGSAAEAVDKQMWSCPIAWARVRHTLALGWGMIQALARRVKQNNKLRLGIRVVTEIDEENRLKQMILRWMVQPGGHRTRH